MKQSNETKQGNVMNDDKGLNGQEEQHEAETTEDLFGEEYARQTDDGCYYTIWTFLLCLGATLVLTVGKLGFGWNLTWWEAVSPICTLLALWALSLLLYQILYRNNKDQEF